MEETKGNKRVRYEVIALFFLILIHTIICISVCKTDRILGTYGDELIYYNIAKSMFFENTVELHGTAFSFQKILFSIYLLPFFSITDAVFRVKMIVLFNSLVVSLGLIPLWLICKEMELDSFVCLLCLFGLIYILREHL